MLHNRNRLYRRHTPSAEGRCCSNGSWRAPNKKRKRESALNPGLNSAFAPWQLCDLGKLLKPRKPQLLYQWKEDKSAYLSRPSETEMIWCTFRHLFLSLSLITSDYLSGFIVSIHCPVSAPVIWPSCSLSNRPENLGHISHSLLPQRWALVQEEEVGKDTGLHQSLYPGGSGYKNISVRKLQRWSSS